ncbi:hypothetical protein CHU92_12160 [Flavobacterium cyanobacteriorum]|uniref:Uncharacterized protein n=1 Tax=Flavobacterium cyanobacteriorum TaxID=2022802 RepID=A0A255YXW4_9FLAO|nr:hypothetical protein CHU92_12160 [Flavobacterium cyanobacteriorum]
MLPVCRQVSLFYFSGALSRCSLYLRAAKAGGAEDAAAIVAKMERLHWHSSLTIPVQGYS